MSELIKPILTVTFSYTDKGSYSKLRIKDHEKFRLMKDIVKKSIFDEAHKFGEHKSSRGEAVAVSIVYTLFDPAEIDKNYSVVMKVDESVVMKHVTGDELDEVKQQLKELKNQKTELRVEDIF